MTNIQDLQNELLVFCVESGITYSNGKDYYSEVTGDTLRELSETLKYVLKDYEIEILVTQLQKD